MRGTEQLSGLNGLLFYSYGRKFQSINLRSAILPMDPPVPSSQRSAHSLKGHEVESGDEFEDPPSAPIPRVDDQDDPEQ